MHAPLLSPRALAWMSTLDVTRRTPPASSEALAALLIARGQSPWPTLLEAEVRFGGLHGQLDYVGDLWLGPGVAATLDCEDAPFIREINGRPHVLVGGMAPALWYADEAGCISELDDLRQLFQRSDSLEKRLEQLAVEFWLEAILPEAAMECLETARGEALAQAYRLYAIEEASDSHMRWWTSPELLTTLDVPGGLVVLESVEPSDYGEEGLVTRTYVHAASVEDLDAALKACRG